MEPNPPEGVGKSVISTIFASQFSIMLIIPVKEGENIERALKRFKKKFDRTKTGRMLRARKEYVKPKTVRREAMKKAVYKNKKALMG